ncbi:hypothetical protein BH18ACT9_BH18ACT9_14450 [soil metagenome]
MNDTMRMPDLAEVTAFVDRVRARLVDLTEEEREELLGGLEADLAERLADGGGVEELGDPDAYADELRSAAGLEHGQLGRLTRRRRRSPRARRVRRPADEIVTERLDDARARWERLMSTGPWLVASWSFLQVLRPGWWLLRAWVAVQLVDIGIGPWEWPTLMPRLGDAWSGPTLLAGAAIGSVLLGMRRLWPASASPDSALARVVLLGLNAFALASLVSVVGSFPSTETLNQTVYVDRMGYAPQERGLENNGRLVHNVYAYDVQGLPIEGVQLFDQAGRPLAVDPEWSTRVRYQGRLPTTYPWQNGEQQLWNVFPLPVREDNGRGRHPGAWESDNPPFLPQPPMVAVPPALLPSADEPAAQPADEPAAQPYDQPVEEPTDDGRAGEERQQPRPTSDQRRERAGGDRR